MRRFIVLIPCCIVSAYAGYLYSKHAYNLEHQSASNLCYSTKNIDAYVSRLGEDEYVCFKEDFVRKKIIKTSLVLQDKPMD
jgi:hypothetical protein